MKRFLMQSNKLANVASATTNAGASTDISTFVDASGFEQIAVLNRVTNTTGDPTVTLNLLGLTASTGTPSSTTYGSVSWTGGSTGDVAALQANVGAKGGVDYHYFAVKLVSSGGTTGVRNLYFLGGPRRVPIATTTTATEDDEHHVNTVKGTTVVD